MPRIKIREGATADELREALRWALEGETTEPPEDLTALEVEPDEEPPE